MKQRSPLLFSIEKEEEAFRKFHDEIHLRIVRVPILLMAILCLPVAILQKNALVMLLVIMLVCGPCLILFGLSFTRFFRHRLPLSLFFFVAAEALIFSFAWVLHLDSAIVFYFVLHFIHLTAFLRLFYGSIFSILFHASKIINDYVYQTYHQDIFSSYTRLGTETLIEVISHVCFIYIAYKTETTARNFFRTRNELYYEKQESEKLLLNTLPQQAIERLALDENPISDRWDNAAIVLVEVTFSEKVQSTETSVLLSEIFYILDELSSQYGLEKVLGFRGDEYVAISTQEKSCHKCATFSFSAYRQITEYLRAWEQNQCFSDQAALRIGIASSTIYGGIVGSERCTYDYWGDGLTLVQKIIASCDKGSIVVSGNVKNALSKGMFNFQPAGSVIVPPFGSVDLFAVSDPSEELIPQGYNTKNHPPINFLGEIFSSSKLTDSKQLVQFDYEPTTTKPTEERIKLNKFTLRFSDNVQERRVVRAEAEASLRHIRVFAALWAILCTLEAIKEGTDQWNQVMVLWPIIALYEIASFFRIFINYSEYALLLLGVMVGIHYLYFAYLTTLYLSFFIYPLFMFYLLPLRYTHAAITSILVYTAYAILLCTFPYYEAREIAQQIIALVVVIVTYNIAAYHVRERLRRLFIFTDSLSWSKQQVEDRLRVIIPTRIISLLRQGQYPIVYNFQDIGMGCVTISNMQALTRDNSYNQIALTLHNFHLCADKITPPGVDKIKTIGPLSLVAGGLPTGIHEDVDYMLMLGKWALGILSILSSASKKNLEPCAPTLCVVLHFGEVFAGIAGTKKYRFDLWGAQMAKLQKIMEAVKTMDQNAIYVTEEAHEVLGKNFIYKSKVPITTAGGLAVYQLIAEAK